MKILKTIILYRTKFLLLNETTYIDQKGVERKWVWTERPNQTNGGSLDDIRAL